jgi:Tol biopolymer transport system component
MVMRVKFRFYLTVSCFIIVCAGCGFWRSTDQSGPGITLASFPTDLNIWEAKWSPDGSKIVFMAEKKGELPGHNAIYVYDLTTKQTKKIPTQAEELSPISDFSLFSVDWTPDGTALTLFGKPTNTLREYEGIWLIDLTTYKMNFLDEGRRYSWSPTGDKLAILDDIDEGYTRIRIRDVESKENQIIHEFNYEGISFNLRIEWSPDGEFLAIQVPGTTADGYAWDEIYLLSVDGLSFHPVIENTNWLLREPTWLPDSGWIAFIIANTPDENIVGVAPITGECLFVWFPQIKRADMVDVTADGKSALVVSWGDLYIVNIEEAVGPELLPNQLRCP